MNEFRYRCGGGRNLVWVMAAAVAIAASGCSVKRIAVNKLGDALAGGGQTFSSDDDPDLIRQAVPFSLKLIESLLAESPRHRGMLLAATSGFAQYAYAFVQQDAERIQGENLEAADKLFGRARRLYLRARDYGLRGLEMRHPGFEAALHKDPKKAVQMTDKDDVPFLYWTAASWGGAITISRTDPELIADQPVVEALIDHALELDEAWEYGALHTFLISYENSRQGKETPPAARARKHFERAMELSQGQQAAPLVVLAEAVALQTQNRAEFESLLQRALAIDPDKARRWRLANLIAQERARWRLANLDELFFTAKPE